MKINLMSSTYLSPSYPTPPPLHGIVIRKTYVYILYIFEFMQGKNWKNLRSTWAQIDRVQNNVQHCVQIALLGKEGGRDRTRMRAETSFQRRLKCKSPLWMCILTIYEYLLIFFLSGSLRSPFLSVSLFVVFSKRQNFCLKCAFHSPKCFSYFFICSMLHYFTTFWWQFYWPFFVGVEQNTFLCMQPTNEGREGGERARRLQEYYRIMGNFS